MDLTAEFENALRAKEQEIENSRRKIFEINVNSKKTLDEKNKEIEALRKDVAAKKDIIDRISGPGPAMDDGGDNVSGNIWSFKLFDCSVEFNQPPQ